MANLGYSMQVFHFYEGIPTLQVDNMKKVLDQIGDRPVAIISVNGAARTGKSFLLNFFARQALMASKPEAADKLLHQCNGFEWKGGKGRTTVGINIWSKPYFVKDKNGREIGVILMDTQGLFDPQTSFNSNSLIFCMSVWLSSVFIYNIKGEVSEDKLQYFEYFTNFANEIANDEKGYGALFQKCMIAVRDWQNLAENDCGMHQRVSTPEVVTGANQWKFEPPTKNYVKDFLMSDDVNEEAAATRQTMLDNFSDVSAFLLPYPGNDIATNDKGVIKGMDVEFAKQVGKMAEWVLGKEYLVPKTIGGVEQTGTSFLPIVEKWATLIKEEEMPKAKNLMAAAGECKLSMQLLRSQKALDTKMDELLATSTSTDSFCAEYEKILDQSLKHFQTATEDVSKHDKDGNTLNELKEYAQRQFDNGLQLLEVRLQKVELAKKEHVLAQRKEEDGDRIRILEEQFKATNALMLTMVDADKSRRQEVEDRARRIRQECEELKKGLENLAEELKEEQKRNAELQQSLELSRKEGYKKFTFKASLFLPLPDTCMPS